MAVPKHGLSVDAVRRTLSSRPGTRTLPGAVGVLVAASVSVFVGLGSGRTALVAVLVGTISVGSWAFFRPPEAVVAGHLGLLAVAPVGPVALAAIEAGFVSMLLAPTLDGAEPTRAAVTTLSGIVIGVGVVFVAFVVVDGLWQVTALSVLVLGVAMYTVHRYERVEMGLVEP